MTNSTLRTASAAAIAVAVASAFGAPAFAAGYDAAVVTPAPMAPVAVAAAPVYVMGTDWSGFYVGAALGYAGAGGDNIFNNDVAGATYGVQAGYLYDFGTAVVGGELQYVGANLEEDSTDVTVDSELRAKLIAGYDAGMFMPYATAGWSQLTTGGALEDTGDGYIYGFGVNYMATENVTVGLEFLKRQYDDFADTGTNITGESLEAKVNYSF